MFLSALLFSVIGDWLKLNYKVVFFCTITAIIIMFCAMNAARDYQGDWEWYTYHYHLMKTYSFSEYLGARIGSITIKPTEPVYYAIAFATARLTGGDVQALSSVITIIDYGLIAIAVFRIGSVAFSNAEVRGSSTALISACLIAITFTLVTQLVRQQMAASLCLLGFSFLLRKQYTFAFIISILAILTHRSSFIYVLILYVPFLALKLTSSVYIRAFVFLGVAISFSLLGYFVAHSSLAELGAKNDGSVSNAIIAIDAAIGIALLFTTITTKDRSGLGWFIALSYIALYAVFIQIMSLPLASLRIYFYMDGLRGAALLCIFASSLPGRIPNSLRAICAGLLLIVAIGYNSSRIAQSPFNFGGSFISYLMYPAKL